MLSLSRATPKPDLNACPPSILCSNTSNFTLEHTGHTSHTQSPSHMTLERTPPQDHPENSDNHSTSLSATHMQAQSPKTHQFDDASPSHQTLVNQIGFPLTGDTCRLPRKDTQKHDLSTGAIPSGGQQEKARLTGISKQCSLILRHKATFLRLGILPDGFVPMHELLGYESISKYKTTVQDLIHIIETDNKKRFEICVEDGIHYIRALQGHSIPFIEESDLMDPITLHSHNFPPHCIHGTYHRHLQYIMAHGIRKGGHDPLSRNHLHFTPKSPTDQTITSGIRPDCEIAFRVDLTAALQAGMKFLRAN